jgi:putative ABC transport system permease protein
MYVTHLQDRRFFAMPRDLVVRTEGDPLGMVAAVRAEIWKLDADLPLFRIQTLDGILSHSVAAQRFNLLLLTVFASLALILAAVGIYGVMSYATAQRTHEIGIRVALGARTTDVLRLVMGQGLRLTVLGVIAGLIGSYGLTRVMTGLLFGVSATDPMTFGLITLLLATVSLVACYIPARRAMKVDPMVALRYE